MTERKDYRVYFSDGNQKLYEAANMSELLLYLASMICRIDVDEIVKIEEV